MNLEMWEAAPTGDSSRNPALLAVLATGLLLASCAAPGGPAPGDVRSKGHPVPLDAGSPADLGFLPRFLGDARIVLLGEYHGFAENLSLARRLFEHLNESAGFNRLALEVAYTDAAGLNEYLETGDEFHLVETELFRAASVANSEESLEFFRSLRRFWVSRPPARRFSIWGIDLSEDLPPVVRGQLLGRIGLLPDGDRKRALLAAFPGSGPPDEAGIETLRRILSDERLGGPQGPETRDLDFFLGHLLGCLRLGRGHPELRRRERDWMMLEVFRRALAEEKDPASVRILALCGARHARKRPASSGEAVLAHLLEAELEGLAGKVRSVLLQPLRAPAIEADAPLAALGGAIREGESLFLPAGDPGPAALREPAAYPRLLGSDAPAALRDFYDAVLLFREGTPVSERKAER